MVGEHRGLWAKQKMQSRQMNIYMTGKHTVDVSNGAFNMFCCMILGFQSKTLLFNMLCVQRTLLL